MRIAYLFRIDGAKENDDFFAAMRAAADVVYQGVDLPVCAAGWAPDLVAVTIEELPDRGSLTLIELEATESAARISCRKYLPEDTAAILAAFTNYLDRVIRKCRSTADHRDSEMVRLKTFLLEANDLTIKTAAGLRSSTRLVEELPLTHPRNACAQPRLAQEVARQNKQRTFHGVVRLSAQEAKALGRCVMVLDAVNRKCDHSDATFHNWRNKAPLKRLLRADKGSRSALHKLLFEVFEQQNRGLTFDFESVLEELVDIWSTAGGTRVEREQIRSLVGNYYPVGSIISSHARMADVFETAREYVARGDLTAPL